MASGGCPKGGSHNWVNVSETARQVTHRCSKCGETYTRSRGDRMFVVLMLVMAAVCVAATIWAGGAA